MTNTEIMRQFFYNLPEVLFGEGKITQEQFEQNKAMWKLYYELPSGTGIQFLEY